MPGHSFGGFGWVYRCSGEPKEETGGGHEQELGIPVKLLREASGHVVTVELKSGEMYRGSVIEREDNWDCQLENITCTAKVCPLFFLLCPLYSPSASYFIRSAPFLSFPFFAVADSEWRFCNLSVGCSQMILRR